MALRALLVVVWWKAVSYTPTNTTLTTNARFNCHQLVEHLKPRSMLKVTATYQKPPNL